MTEDEGLKTGKWLHLPEFTQMEIVGITHPFLSTFSAPAQPHNYLATGKNITNTANYQPHPDINPPH